MGTVAVVAGSAKSGFNGLISLSGTRVSAVMRWAWWPPASPST